MGEDESQLPSAANTTVLNGVGEIDCEVFIGLLSLSLSLVVCVCGRLSLAALTARAPRPNIHTQTGA